MEKYVIKNEYGEFTAVLISPDYGSGYSTWHYGHPMDGKVIKDFLSKIEDFNPNEVDEETEIDVSDYAIDFPGELVVNFVPVGSVFRITEYDGAESIEYYTPNDYYTA